MNYRIRIITTLVALAGLEATARADTATTTAVTFTKDVAPIVFSQCMPCHRTGEVGPFPLTNFAEVKKKAKTIRTVLGDGFMPPWHADSHGEFLNERKLTAAQKELLFAWIDGGQPEGAATDLPPTPHFTAGWQLGEPDLVLEPEGDFTLPAEGRDLYRCFVLPTSYETDRNVSAIEVRPGNRSVVHHALLYIDTTGAARKLDAADPGLGYTSFGGVGFTPQGGLGGWAPGIAAAPLPDGVGHRLPKGADVVLQVHYHKSGKPETDRTKVGIYFSKKPVDKLYRSIPVTYRAIRIPAGEANYKVQTSFPVPRDVTVLSVTPHMHLLGREMKVTATLPDGTTRQLVHVPDWDFNWQTTYWFKEPLHLPADSHLDLTARYDNSAANPNNPSSPPVLVVRGEQTTNEMCIAFVGFTVDSEHLIRGQGAVGALGLGRGGAAGSFLQQSRDDAMRGGASAPKPAPEQAPASAKSGG
jgi:hypothetical protein